jgi:hypothetical protein
VTGPPHFPDDPVRSGTLPCPETGPERLGGLVGPVGVGRVYATPTGAPCPRCVRVDGSVEGSGDCLGCGYCLIMANGAWSD